MSNLSFVLPKGCLGKRPFYPPCSFSSLVTEHYFTLSTGRLMEPKSPDPGFLLNPRPVSPWEVNIWIGFKI